MGQWGYFGMIPAIYEDYMSRLNLSTPTSWPPQDAFRFSKGGFTENGCSDRLTKDLAAQHIFNFFHREAQAANGGGILSNIVGSDYPNNAEFLGPEDSGGQLFYAGQRNSIYFAGGGDDTVESGSGNDMILGDMYVNQSVGYPHYWKFVIAGYDNNSAAGPEIWGVGNTFPTGPDSTGFKNKVLSYGWDYLDTMFLIGSGADQLYGGGGEDTVFGFGGNDYLNGEAGNDWLDSGSGDDTVAGGSGSDILFGGAGNDVLYGYHDDSYVGRKAPSATPQLKQDTDYAADGANLLYGGEGNDILYAGNSGNDSLYGGAGNDTLNSGVNGAYLDGGEGQNTYVLSGNDTIIGNSSDETFTFQVGNNLYSGEGGNDILSGGSGNDTLIGGEDNDTLSGASGVNMLDGGVGDDELIAGDSGLDTLYGGAGNDVLDAFSYGGAMVAGDGNDTLYGGGNASILLGGNGSDDLYGGSGNDYLDGGADDDIILGGTGNDELLGGGGVDVLAGGAGDDLYHMYQGSGWSAAMEFADEGYDTVLISDYGIADVSFERINDDLFLYDGTSTDVMQFQDWFVNFEVESFTFASSGMSFENADVAALFGVTIPV